MKIYDKHDEISSGEFWDGIPKSAKRILVFDLDQIVS